MRRFLPALALLLCLPLSACFTITWDKPDAKPADDLRLAAVSFETLPGWSDDAVSQAIVPLQRSCARILKAKPEQDFGAGDYSGTMQDWQQACADLNDAVPMTNEEARAFFEEYFTPYEMSGGKGREGLFTGYYEPILQGSTRKHKPYLYPIYGRPEDLVAVNLGDFRPELKGETIKGRVKGEKLVPYYTRAEIEKGALKGKKQEIVWVDNAVDAFFLHIQGSGQIKLKGGKTLRVGYADQNGQTYLAVGKALLERGALTKDNVSMQSIRQWLEEHPDEAAAVMDLNMSYVFFRKLKGEDGPLGAEGTALIPGRSIAVDRRKVPYGAPIFLDAEEPEGEGRLQRLMIAQDTGGAITGAVRGDFFWGAGDEAAHKAGLMKSKGYAWILLPKTLAPESAKPALPDFFRNLMNKVRTL